MAYPRGWILAPRASTLALVRRNLEAGHHYGCSPPVDVVDIGQVRFPFIPVYLNYIMFELLKNSLRAVTERYGGDRARVAERPVRVVVCGDESIVVVRISDCGGACASCDGVLGIFKGLMCRMATACQHVDATLGYPEGRGTRRPARARARP
ncbi:unnamed protein product [Prorocentrum cordatum]|uniref:Protein-serine/threonine kinase n=1 Tax=Prorocentrum cordatum TaxID=2364126 RepID=A0ABN9U1A3_9DINO|nr:unnamed protein product [Polarella glacialis]